MKSNKLPDNTPGEPHNQQTGASQDAKGDYRTCARVLALQFLHQLSVQKGKSLEMLDYFLNQQSDDRCKELARQWILGTWRNAAQIDKHIKQVSTNWDLKRISIVDSANLRLAIYQLLYCPEIPPKVVINEAIELAKRFSTHQAPSFVNGILDAVLKTIAPQQ